ncbi:MAG: hypothetical protein WAV67_01945, partial [Dokdonella sp.]
MESPQKMTDGTSVGPSSPTLLTTREGARPETARIHAQAQHELRNESQMSRKTLKPPQIIRLPS